MSGHSAENGARRATVAEAIAAWEAKGPTSLTVALMAEALYDARDRLEAVYGPRTHDGNHAPLPEGTWLAPGFCGACDEERARVLPPAEGREVQP